MNVKRRTYRVNADSWTVLRDILVATPEDFNPDSASLRGRNVELSAYVDMGRLPQEYVNEIRDSRVGYVIYSYGTPIAWRRIAEWRKDGGPVWEWRVPEERYSVTTSKHQGKVRTALSQISGGID